MSTEAPAAPASAPAAAPARVQRGPTPPATSLPPTERPSSAAQSMDSAPKGNVPPAQVSLRDGLKNLYNQPATPKADAPPPKPAGEAPTPPAADAPASEAPKSDKPSLFDSMKPKVEVKPPAEAPADSDPFAHVKPPEGISENALTGWKALKTEAAKKLADTESRWREAQARLDLMAKAAPAETAEVATLKEQHQKALDRLAVLDLQNHPDFEKQYVQPKTKAIEEAKMLMADNAVTDAVDFNALLGKPRSDFAKAVTELASKMNDFDKVAFTASMREARRVHDESRGALEQAATLRSGIEAKTAAQQKQAFSEVFGNLGEADAFLNTVQIPDSAPPEEKAELAAYNQSVAQVRSMAEANAFGRLDPKGAAAIASKAAILDFVVKTAMPRLNREYSTVVAERNALAAELSKIKAAKNPGNFEAPAGGAPSGKAASLAEGIKALWRNGQ